MSFFSWFAPDNQTATLILALMLQIALIVVIGWCVCWLAARHNPAMRSAIWLTALLCVLASPLLTWGLQHCGVCVGAIELSFPTSVNSVNDETLLSNRGGVASVSTPNKSPDSDEVISDTAVTASVPASPGSRATNPGITADSVANRPTEAASYPAWNIVAGGLVLAWLAGCLVQFIRLAAAFRMLRRLRRRAIRIDDSLPKSVLREVRRALGVQHLPAIYSSRSVTGPVAAGGIGRVIVILPTGMSSDLERAELSDVLIHECAHVLRRDIAVGLLQQLARMLFWPHLLVHLLNIELTRAREDVCDNFVLRRTTPTTYVRRLCRIAQRQRVSRLAPGMVGMFHRSTPFEKRAAGILHERRNLMTTPRRGIATTLIALLLAFNVLLAGTRVDAEDDVTSTNSVFVEQRDATAAPIKPKLLRVFTAPSLTYRIPRKRDKGRVHDVSFGPNGKKIASARFDGTVVVWDVKTANKISVLEGHEWWVCCVAFSPDGQSLASGGSLRDKSVKIWRDFERDEENEKPRTLKGHRLHVWSVAYSPNGKLLASGSWDTTIRLWNPSTGDALATLKGHRHYVYSVAFSPNGKLLASGSADSTIRLWDVATRKSLRVLEAHTKGRNVNAVAFSPDGTILASAGGDGTIRLWDVETGKNIATLRGHSHRRIYDVTFSPDGRTLASAGRDNAVMLWNVAKRKRIAVLRATRKTGTTCVSFSPDGKLLAAGGEFSIRLWDLTGKQ